jgi:hypothetical protein
MFFNNSFAMIFCSLFELFKRLVFPTIEIEPSQDIQCLLMLKLFPFLMSFPSQFTSVYYAGLVFIGDYADIF